MFSRASGPGPVNSAPCVFLDPTAREFYIDWGRAASDVVAILRSAEALNLLGSWAATPGQPELQDAKQRF